MSTEAETIEYLNRFRESFLDDLGCTIVGVDQASHTCEMTFKISHQYCHSGDIIQGGFVSAMLDAVSTHALFALGGDETQPVTQVATLEFKTIFFEASRAGLLHALGRVDKVGRSIAFLSAELRNAQGQLTATMTSIAKVRRGQLLK